MAVQITASGKKNPNNPQDPIKFYPRTANTGEVDLDILADKIAFSNSLTPADCYGVIISLVKEIETELSNGKIVRLGRLGSFQISVKGKPALLASDIKPSSVVKSSIVFRPGKILKKMLLRLDFFTK